jgi:hypothetical protein
MAMSSESPDTAPKSGEKVMLKLCYNLAPPPLYFEPDGSYLLIVHIDEIVLSFLESTIPQFEKTRVTPQYIDKKVSTRVIV